MARNEIDAFVEALRKQICRGISLWKIQIAKDVRGVPKYIGVLHPIKESTLIAAYGDDESDPNTWRVSVGGESILGAFEGISVVRIDSNWVQVYIDKRSFALSSQPVYDGRSGLLVGLALWAE